MYKRLYSHLNFPFQIQSMQIINCNENNNFKY